MTNCLTYGSLTLQFSTFLSFGATLCWFTHPVAVQVKARRTLPPFLGREGRYSLAIDQVASLHGRSESIRFRRRAWPGAFRNCPRGSVWPGVPTQCGCGWIRSIRHHSLHPFMSPLWTFCRPLLLSCTCAMMTCWSCLDWRSTIVVPLSYCFMLLIHDLKILKL